MKRQAFIVRTIGYVELHVLILSVLFTKQCEYKTFKNKSEKNLYEMFKSCKQLGMISCEQTVVFSLVGQPTRIYTNPVAVVVRFLPQASRSLVVVDTNFKIKDCNSPEI